MFLHLGRLIQDFQFWTSFEVGQVYVPNAFVQISSIMPQKRNPVPIEHMRLLASQTMGRARTVLGVIHNTPFTDMNDSEGETQSMGYEAFRAASRVLDLLAAFVGAIRSIRSVWLRTSAAPASPSPSLPTRWCASRACPSARRTRSRRRSPRQWSRLAAGLPRMATRRSSKPSAFDRTRTERSAATSSKRSSRPNISLPCATVSAARRPAAMAEAIGGYAEEGSGIGAVAQEHAGARGESRELGEKFKALAGAPDGDDRT
jgi:argininosuccinate lyase